MSSATPITVAHGDGIGPEIMAACLSILQEAGAKLDIETIEIGQAVYERGHDTGIEPSAWDSLRNTRVFYKAPITTPQGGGFKSLNVTVRKTLGLFANVRPCASYAPYIDTKHPNMDVIVVRENEEDLYAGIEHRQTPQVYQCLKLISEPGSRKIVRYAFEHAKRHNRKKVTCFTKDNIMKLTDGLFHRIFDEIAAEYPDIENEHWIIDIGAAKLADSPDAFDVVVMPNLYGDILSDVAAQIAGSVGLAGSSNIGAGYAMFEAIHGSAPRRAGQNLANPSGLLHGGILMLLHIGQAEVAQKVHNAWLKTIEDGIHTYDIYTEERSSQKVGTKEFAQAVIERLGQEPETLKAVKYDISEPADVSKFDIGDSSKVKKELVGFDAFICWTGSADDLASKLKNVETESLKLQAITNRGVHVWPEGHPETFCSDHWRCRFLKQSGAVAEHSELVQVLSNIADAKLDFIKTENLCKFDGKPAYSGA